MTAIPKHEPTRRKGAKKSPQPATVTPTRVEVTGPDVPSYTPTPSLQHDINHVEGLGEVAAHLDWIGDAVARLTSDDHYVGLALCQNRYGGPVKLTLADNDDDDTMGRLTTAFERIADSVARLAGLSRPRLEPWHEQDEYTPRYKDIACDGGAPGPKQAADGQKS